MKIFEGFFGCVRFCTMFLLIGLQSSAVTYAETPFTPHGFDYFDSTSLRGSPLNESQFKIGTKGIASHQVPQQPFFEDSNTYGWTRLGAQFSKPHSRISYKDLLEIKYDYFIVGLYRETVVGLGPMIEFSLDQKYKLWAIVPTIRRDADSHTILVIGISKEF